MYDHRKLPGHRHASGLAAALLGDRQPHGFTPQKPQWRVSMMLATESIPAQALLSARY
jgi:hypothetical protein